MVLDSSGAVSRQTSAAVQAGNATPDKVATALMPVPIYNFAVHNVAFSPDGGTLAAGDGSGVVRLWNTQTGELKATVAAHTNWAFSVAWLADGTQFATGGGDNLVHLFDAAKVETPIRTFRGHRNDVHAVLIAPDGQRLISAGDDKQIIIWNAGGKEERRWIAHEQQIPTVAINGKGTMIASGSRDDSIRLWDLNTGRLRSDLIGHSDDVLSVRFSPNDKFLASAGYDQTVRLWEVASGRALRIFKGHTNRVFSVAWSPDGERLASAGDATVRIWHAKSGAALRVISIGGSIETPEKKIPENLSAVAFAPDGKRLAVSSTTGLVFLVSVETGDVLRKFEPSKP